MIIRSSLSYSCCFRFSSAGEVDLQVARPAVAVDHADGVAAERRDVVDRQLGRQRLDRPAERGAVEPEGRGELVGVEVDGLAEPAVDQPLQAEQDGPLDVGLRAEPVDQAGEPPRSSGSTLIRTIAMFSRGRNFSIAPALRGS